MLFTKTIKTLKEKSNESTNNGSWIKESENKNYKGKNKTSRTEMAENNSKLFLSEKFDFEPEEILDKLLLFDFKKTSEEKIFDSILEKIPDKNDIYYIEHREGTNAFRIRKDSK